MPARSVGAGNVSFGLVSIPVRMYSTTETSGTVRFNMLDPSDNTRVKQELVNSRTGEPVKRGDLIKGYEYGRGQYVTFTKDELRGIEKKASPSIEIKEFVPLSEVEPIYFEKSYYLGPERGGERAYRLLSQAMRTTGRSALARHCARGRHYLVMLRPFGPGLLMQQLKYEDELKSFDEVPLGDDVELVQGELDLAIQLVEQIANDEFQPDKYTDEVRQRVWQAIQDKIDGREIEDDESEAPTAQIFDMMEALKASLKKKEDEAAASKRSARKKSARRTASAPAKRAAVG